MTRAERIEEAAWAVIKRVHGWEEHPMLAGLRAALSQPREPTPSHADAHGDCPVCGPVTPGDFPPTPAATTTVWYPGACATRGDK